MLSKKTVVGLLIILMMAVSLSAASESMMSVQVRETQVRGTPSFLGKIIAKLVYGDRVEVMEQGKGWAKVVVPNGGGEGWVSQSALTEKQIVLKAGSKDVSTSASSGEVALAGKGFNEQVESQYRADTNLDYTWIDLMEEIFFPPDELVSFMLQGDLSPSEEGGAE